MIATARRPSLLNGVGWLSLLLMLGGVLVPGAAWSQPPTRPDSSGKPTGHESADTAQLRWYRLKYLPATEAVRILQEVFRDQAGPKGSLYLSTDDRTNSLILRGDPAVLTEMVGVLEKLDVATADRGPSEAEFQVLPLRGLEPNQALEEALRLALGNRPGRFVVDRSRHAVLVYGDKATVEAARTLLAALEVTAEDRSSPIGELPVRVAWLVNGLPQEEVPPLPDDLKDVASELARLGLDRPRVVTILSARTLPGARFEMSGIVQLDTPYRVSVSGTINDGGGQAAAVEITVKTVQAPAGQEPIPVTSLRTQVAAPIGHSIVLGTAPTGQLHSAFVLMDLRPRPAAAAAPPAKPKEKGKKYSFEMRGKPWRDVLAWLSEQTGLSVVGNERPGGTFTFIPPKGATYTIPEIIDIVNDSLLAQKYLLIRGEHSLTVVAADEKVDPALVPRVRIEDLPEHGKTELVSVLFSLKGLVAEDVAPDVRKLLGPFGEVHPFKATNQLLVQDTAGTVRQIAEVLQAIDVQSGQRQGEKSPTREPKPMKPAQ